MKLFYKATMIDVNTHHVQMFLINGIGKTMIDVTETNLWGLECVTRVPSYGLYLINAHKIEQKMKDLFPLDKMERIL